MFGFLRSFYIFKEMNENKFIFSGGDHASQRINKRKRTESKERKLEDYLNFFKKIKEVNCMVYKHGNWTLYTRTIKLKGGKTATIHFFSTRVPKYGTPCDLPDGHTVGVNKRTNLPYVRKR